MTIPARTLPGFLGAVLVLFGLLLVMVGIGIVRVKKYIEITPGKKTWVIGIIAVLVGMVLVLLDIETLLPPPHQFSTIVPAASPVIAPTNTPSPISPQPTAKPTSYQVWPISDTGVEACHLLIGEKVLARKGADLWTKPDATNGVELSTLELGTQLEVKSGPVWGSIRKDIKYYGWWYEVRVVADNRHAWVWEARMEGCADPESFK